MTRVIDENIRSDYDCMERGKPLRSTLRGVRE